MLQTQQQPSATTPRRIAGVGIISTGQAIGTDVITNEDLAKSHGFDPDWIVERTGIHRRQHAAPGVTTSDLACQAARNCVETSGISAAEIDLLLVATLSPDHLVPSVSSYVQDHLQLKAGAMDIHASCAGFVYALITGSQFIATGACGAVLVVAADTSTRFADPADKKSFPLFGDGAGAVLLKRGSIDQGILATDFGSDGPGEDLLYVSREAEPRLSMDGPRVFKWAVNKLCESIEMTLSRAGKRIDEIDRFVLHQANLRILNSVAKTLHIQSSRLVTGVEHFGNTATASIPMALDREHRRNPICSGEHLLLSGFGGGLTWASCVVRW